jgi:hypothetical protein
VFLLFSILVNFVQFQVLSASINAACLALMDAGIPLTFPLASLSCAIPAALGNSEEDADILLLDPTLAEQKVFSDGIIFLTTRVFFFSFKSSLTFASFLFLFSMRDNVLAVNLVQLNQAARANFTFSFVPNEPGFRSCDMSGSFTVDQARFFVLYFSPRNALLGSG